jgi:hypothetical protein
MKKLLLLVSLLVFVLINVACSEEPPSVRVKNERTNKTNVQLKQADGNTININDVAGGSVTGYRDLVEGQTQATAVIQNEAVSPSIPFSAAKDRNYTVVVTNSNPPTLRVDSEDK